MQTLNLNGIWRLSPLDSKAIAPHCSYFTEHEYIPCTLPGDIHSALLDADVIADPYVGQQELDIQWVGQHDWVLSKTFFIEKSVLAEGSPILTLKMADTIITLHLNGEEVGSTDNQFRRWRFDLGGKLKAGENTLNLTFTSAEKKATEVAETLPYPIPYSEYPVSAKHRNLVRKSQCHSGWDWGPCILAMGVYEPIEISFIDEGIIEQVNCETNKRGTDQWDAVVRVIYNAKQEQSLPCSATLAGVEQTGKAKMKQGLNRIEFRLQCKQVKQWWPNGEGKATLYPLQLKIGTQKVEKRIGFRTLQVRTETERDGGKPMVFNVNGRDIFAKGTNWIPLDALPSRLTADRYEYLLQSCVDANMNMIRVWGGGLYEKDVFYNLCDEKGLLVWQDCMFSCSMYPSNPEFLASVEAELRYQVPRLKDHPSLALWCGNNEDLGAISWYEESRKNHVRYVIDYDRLNEGVVGRVIKELDPQRQWWPSSPSAGENDYSDNWHDDSKGDMHFWSVWHEGKSFEEYYSINPRFVSEFGFQSFPLLDTVKSYATEEMWNLTSKVMEHHQKNPRGNSIIMENFTRYYRFPSSFAQMLYLSQVQQAKAMKMAIEYWRTTMPHCMGALYWQLNDNWPVASWSSIDYWGNWKLLHYAAKRFYSPALPIAFMKEDGIVEVYVVNDGPKEIKDAKLSVKFCTYEGKKLSKMEYRMDCKAKSSTHMCTINLHKKRNIDRENTFIYLKLKSDELYIENQLMLEKPKRSNLRNPEIKKEVTKTAGGFSVTVRCTYPAFEVALEAEGISGVFSDNLFAIRPTAQKIVTFKTRGEVTLEEFKKKLKIYDLWSSSH
ncbi:MAG: beta-mannosidase [Sphaerochaeta sp.]|jgi:beta-mannosidase|nr:beta-mannosidase [Sphaerochaeta sp.]